MAHLYFLPSPCGTSEQHEVKAGHLLTSVRSRRFSDLQPYLRWPSASPVCCQITASSQAQDKICSAFFALCHFPSTNVCLSKHKYQFLNKLNIVAECNRQQQTLLYFFPLLAEAPSRPSHFPLAQCLTDIPFCGGEKGLFSVSPLIIHL